MHNVKRMVAKQQELFKQFLEENLDQAINVQWEAITLRMVLETIEELR